MKGFALYKQWSKEIEAQCEKALGNKPAADIDFRNSRPFPDRRHFAVFEKPTK